MYEGPMLLRHDECTKNQYYGDTIHVHTTNPMDSSACNNSHLCTDHVRALCHVRITSHGNSENSCQKKYLYRGYVQQYIESECTGMSQLLHFTYGLHCTAGLALVEDSVSLTVWVR